jgi:hypothetical protein
LACYWVVEGDNEADVVNGDGEGDGLEGGRIAVLFAEPLGEVNIGLYSYH